jgi:hypothetical protein
MLKTIYSKYFQKSKSFLYPGLGTRRSDPFTPTGTYLSIDGYIGPEDVKLVCTFEKNESSAFKEFETQMLTENPLYEQKIEVENYYVYIFDFEIYEDDWFSFLLGRYSRLSPMLKKAIKQYYGKNSSEYKFIETYLYPEEHFENYAKILDVNVEDLKEIGELCNPYDEKKETLKIPKEYLEKLKHLI